MITIERTWRDAFVREPARIAIGQPHQLFLSGMSITFTAAFFYDALGKLPFLHPALAGAVAVAGAIGAEYAYLKGLSDGARVGGASPWQGRLIATVCGLLIISGTLVLMTHAYPVAALTAPVWWVALLLTLAHIVPLALLGLCSAKLHAEVEAAEGARAVARQRETQERTQRLEADADARRQRREQAEDAADARQMESLADVAAEKAKALARLEYRAAVRANTTTANTPNTADTASGQPTNSVRARIVRTLREHPKSNKSDLAQTLGIGRTALYTHIKAARAAGELPTEEN